MNELTQIIKSDMIPALGVTEPGAIAFSVAKARSYTNGRLKCVKVSMNSGMYKNAFTCGIPNSNKVGNIFAAALGYVAGNADKGLEALADVTEADNVVAQELIDQGKVAVELSGITSRIYIRATVETDSDKAVITIRDSHTNIIKIEVNDEVIFENKDENREDISDTEDETVIYPIHKYSLADILEYVENVPAEEIAFVSEAYRVNLELFNEGIKNPRTTFARTLLEINGGEVISSDEKNTASLLCNAAIEARVIGLDKPAMSITGSGAHGIIATLPLFAYQQIHKEEVGEDKLLRATALSYLITMYIKEYSGRLSAFCGCGIAAGTGMACGLCYLKGGQIDDITRTICNMASGITGMICDGGNQGCTMKGVVAVDAAFRAVSMAMNGVSVDSVHGINGKTPEDTMKHMGQIASPGMTATEETIVEIMQEK